MFRNSLLGGDETKGGKIGSELVRRLEEELVVKKEEEKEKELVKQ